MTDPAGPLTPADRVRGCLLGGAVGDALGAAVEFDSLAEMRARLGPAGVTDYSEAYGVVGAITDDTQMTLFTAEGLIRARQRAAEKGINDTVSVVDHAYARWLATQGGVSERWALAGDVGDGWLSSVRGLRTLRAPGLTCLSAMRSAVAGTIREPLNASKGAGGVMRIAPVGLVAAPADRFRLGCEIAALTHGHPSGYLAAGAFASIVGAVFDGAGLADAIEAVEPELITYEGHEEVLGALNAARTAAATESPSADAVEQLAQGWVAEEALAIALACALWAQDFAHGVLLAVNHSGDSDTTGAITGNLLGVFLGESAIPARCIERLELKETIATVADDLVRHCIGPGDVENPDADSQRYPGW